MTVNDLLSAANSSEPEVTGYYRFRPPFKPVTLGELAGLVDDAAGSQAAPSQMISREARSRTQAKKGQTMIKRIEKTKIMHRVVEHSGVVYLGGVIADEVNGTSMRDQAAEVCGKIEKLLSDAGSDKSKLLSATVFITDMSQKAEMNDVWTSWLPAEDLPCRATIGVSDLGQNVLIEIVVTAAA